MELGLLIARLIAPFCLESSFGGGGTQVNPKWCAWGGC